MEIDFLCLNCKTLPESIYECIKCGSPYCNKCCLISKIKCKECASFEFQISPFGNMAINTFEITCSKCTMKIQRNMLKNHLAKECKSSTVKCLFTNCSKNCTRNDIALHVLSTHEQEVLDYFDSSKKTFPQLIQINRPSTLDKIPVFPDFNWPNYSKTYIHQDNKMYTLTTSMSYQGHWKAKVFVKRCTNPGYVVLGIFNRSFNENKGYLGGDLGPGNWGIAGNGACGECGHWTHDKTYKEGDIVSIIYDNGYVSYQINGIGNNYKFKFSTFDEPTYLAATVYYQGTTLIILDC